MRVKRVELALDETTGMKLAAVGSLLMVALFIADERRDHADVLSKAARALIAQIPEERLHDIIRFATDIVRDAAEDEGSKVGKVQ